LSLRGVMGSVVIARRLAEAIQSSLLLAMTVVWIAASILSSQ